MLHHRTSPTADAPRRLSEKGLQPQPESTELENSSTNVDALLCQATYIGENRDGLRIYGDDMQKFFETTPQERVRIICTEFPRPMLLQSTIFNVDFLNSKEILNKV